MEEDVGSADQLNEESVLCQNEKQRKKKMRINQQKALKKFDFPLQLLQLSLNYQRIDCYFCWHWKQMK